VDARGHRQIGVVGCDTSGTASHNGTKPPRCWFFLQIVMLAWYSGAGRGAFGQVGVTENLVKEEGAGGSVL
jgi:hypothetical protein